MDQILTIGREDVENGENDTGEIASSVNNGEDMSVTSTCYYLITEEKEDARKVYFIDGDKAGSKWMVMDTIHIL